jgi:hypothetical protein
MSKHLVRRHATDRRNPDTGEKQLVYVASCSHCGWFFKTLSKSKRNSEADAHK